MDEGTVRMGSQSACRPATPVANARARSITAGQGRATIVGVDAEPVRPDLYRLASDGSAALLLADEHPLHAAVDMAPTGEVATMVEIADIAPVALRQPVRALLWISGWLQPLSPDEAKRAALWIADTQPAPRLLDVGHRASILWLRPAFVVLADADGGALLRPCDLVHASPDPLRDLESDWLHHLDHHHTELIAALADQAIAADPRGERRKGRVRPLGLDRLGLRLRVEGPDDDTDVRLAFERPVDDPAQLAAEVGRLAVRMRRAGAG